MGLDKSMKVPKVVLELGCSGIFVAYQRANHAFWRVGQGGPALRPGLDRAGRTLAPSDRTFRAFELDAPVINSVGLLLVWFLVGRNHTFAAWLMIFASDACRHGSAHSGSCSPELYWYVGMSGMLHGLLAAGLVARLPDMDAETVVLSC